MSVAFGILFLSFTWTLGIMAVAAPWLFRIPLGAIALLCGLGALECFQDAWRTWRS